MELATGFFSGLFRNAAKSDDGTPLIGWWQADVPSLLQVP